MQKVKILHIIKSLGRGGAEMLLPETLKLHDRDHFEFHYIYFLPWKNQMVEEIENAGGVVHCFSASNNLKMLAKYKEVVAYCEHHKIAVIHCHLPWSGFVGRMVHKATNIPVIYSEHNIQEKYHFATRILNKISFNSQSLALGVSEDVTQSIARNIHPTIPFKTVLNGVNTESFQKDKVNSNRIKKQYNIPGEAVVIGNIAVFREQKALDVWVKAFKIINDLHPETYGILVGAGPKEEGIKNLINELGLSKKIVLPGLQKDTLSYFSAMDVFMMSSAFEGLPIALLEAMSSNCAIVSTNVGGVPEAIRENVDGLLCEPGNPEMLAKKALGIIENPQKMNSFQKAARARAVDAFSMKNMVHELEQCYLGVK